MKVLNMAVIGCGDIAGYMAYALKFNPKIKVVGCADIDITKAQRFASRFKVPFYSDYIQMLRETKPEAVYLAVPHYLHYPMMKELINANMHVLCEKPITTNLEDAIEICNLSQQRGVKIAVNYQYRYDKACYAMVAASHQGHLGRLYYGICNVPWHRDTDYFVQGSWRGKKALSGGGTLLTQGSHALDILIWALGGTPVSARGIIANRKFNDVEVEDLAMGIVQLDNGAFAQITSSMISTPEQPVTIQVYGEKGTAIYQGPDFPKVRFKGVRTKRQRPPVKGIHALTRSLEAFRRWVIHDEIPLNTAQQSLPVLAAITAIYRSAISGREEKVELLEANGA